MEIWIKINGYKNYQVSNLGNVKTTEKMVKHSHYENVFCTRKERLISPALGNNGYFGFSMSEQGEVKRKSLHRIIAEAFIPNPENKPCVNHKNGIKTDNRIENLEWVTKSENSIHSFEIGLNYPRYGMKGKIGIKNKKSKKVKQLSLSGQYIKTWDSLHCVKRELGFNPVNICHCALNKRPTAYGFKWQY